MKYDQNNLIHGIAFLHYAFGFLTNNNEPDDKTMDEISDNIYRWMNILKSDAKNNNTIDGEAFKILATETIIPFYNSLDVNECMEEIGNIINRIIQIKGWDDRTSKALLEGLQSIANADGNVTEFEKELFSAIEKGLLVTEKTIIGEDDKILNHQFSSENIDIICRTINKNKILPHLPFIFKDLDDKGFHTDKHLPFYFHPNLIVGEEYKGFVYINMDGFYSNCQNSDEIDAIGSWEMVKDIQVKFDKTQNRAILAIIHNEGMLTLEEKDGTSLRIANEIYHSTWRHVLNEFKDAPIIDWNDVKTKLGIKVINCNSWDELINLETTINNVSSETTNDKLEDINLIKSPNCTTDVINQIIKKYNYYQGSDDGDELMQKIASHTNTSTTALEDFVLSGKHPVSIVKAVCTNPSCDEDIMDELYQKEDTKEWKKIDELILKHPNCPKEILDSQIDKVHDDSMKVEEPKKTIKKTSYPGLEEWKKSQKSRTPKGDAAKKKFRQSLRMIEFLHNELYDAFADTSGFEMRYGKTSGCTGYANRKKFFEINCFKSGTIALLLIKDFEKDYRIPIINSLTTDHPRKYNPEKPSTAAFGEQYVITVPDMKTLKSKLSILLSLCNRSFELATTNRDKILKIYEADDISQENLEQQKIYLDPNYTYLYKE